MQRNILLLGDPRLRRIAEKVRNTSDVQFLEEKEQLKTALEKFREEKKFGRGIAAPQIGINKRFVALNIGERSFTIINPVITWKSRETFRLWDDCMSFPDLLVKVKRHTSVSLKYLDENGEEQVLEKLDPAYSELLQHELDHLDGILAVDRAIDKESIMYRSVFESNKDFFLQQVDSVI
ncbi:MAG: peptide deformylase [Bacteroidales bacterium]|nr:peptide deformylase [Bacteroidales bacterium]